MALINPFRLFTRPEYLFRPSQVAHRFQRMISGPPPGDFLTVTLPWGAPLRVRHKEVIGANIWCYGLFDLIVAEAITRLMDKSEVALDIGANIGQMTSLMRCRAGEKGRVHAFEPHPVVFGELDFNVKQTSPGLCQAPVELHNFGLSESDGTASLDSGENWEENRGLARVVVGAASPSSRTTQIQIKRLDSVLPADVRVDVCKMDVEGHELSVLKGAKRLLAEGRIRDIVFEDFNSYPGPVHQRLIEAGYTLFCLHLSSLRPSLSQPSASKDSAEAGNYLATREPQRAVERFRDWGWQVLRG